MCVSAEEERMLNTGSHAGEYIEWLTIKNQVQAVVDDVERIRNHPLVAKSIPNL